MSSPMLGYPEREPSAEYVDDDLIEEAPYVHTWCAECARTTCHADYCDEHGANRVTACRTCRRIVRVHPFLK